MYTGHTEHQWLDLNGVEPWLIASVSNAICHRHQPLADDGLTVSTINRPQAFTVRFAFYIVSRCAEKNNCICCCKMKTEILTLTTNNLVWQVEILTKGLLWDVSGKQTTLTNNLWASQNEEFWWDQLTAQSMSKKS